MAGTELGSAAGKDDTSAADGEADGVTVASVLGEADGLASGLASGLGDGGADDAGGVVTGDKDGALALAGTGEVGDDGGCVLQPPSVVPYCALPVRSECSVRPVAYSAATRTIAALAAPAPATARAVFQFSFSHDFGLNFSGARDRTRWMAFSYQAAAEPETMLPIAAPHSVLLVPNTEPMNIAVTAAPALATKVTALTVLRW